MAKSTKKVVSKSQSRRVAIQKKAHSKLTMPNGGKGIRSEKLKKGQTHHEGMVARMRELETVMKKNGNSIVFIATRNASHTDGMLSISGMGIHEVSHVIENSFPVEVMEHLLGHPIGKKFN